MRNILYVLFLIIFLLLGCEDETSNVIPTNPSGIPSELVGSWNFVLRVIQNDTNAFTSQLANPADSILLTIEANGNWVYRRYMSSLLIRETGRSRWLGLNRLRVYFDTVATGSSHQAGDSITATCLYGSDWMSLTTPREDQPQFLETEMYLKLAANSGTLIGLAADSQGNPIRGALIDLSGPVGTILTVRDTSDQYGFFSVGGLAPGNYTVTGSYNNQTRSTTAQIYQGRITTVNFIFGSSGGNGTITGTIRDVNTSSPLSGVTVSSDVNVTATTDANGVYTMSVASGLRILTASLNNYLSSTAVVFVNANQTVTQDLYLAPTNAAQGTVNGTVRDAVNNQPIGDVTIQVTGGPSTTTNASGFYTLSLNPGTHAIFASKVGYFSSNVTVLQVMSGQTVTQNFSLSPRVTGGRFRIVLRWGTSPEDLDSHLLTPNNGHIAYFSRGDSTRAPYAWLDLDDVDGEGPETITIYQFQSGTYKYFVHNYDGSPDITASSAVVQIYNENGLIAQFSVPTSPVAGYRYWYVCNIDGDTREVTAVNQLQSNPPTISGDWIWAHPKE